MSRQTRALHKPGKAAADSAPAELPKGSIRQMHARFAARAGRPAPTYPMGITCVSPSLIAAIASLPEEFTTEELGRDDRLRGMSIGRIRQQTSLLKRAGQLELLRRGVINKPGLYRRLPAFNAAQAPQGPPLTALEIRYRALRAEIQTAPCPFGDVLEHPQR